MAGIAKPNYSVKKEGGYNVIGGYVTSGSIKGLFDGTTPKAWNTPEIAYFSSYSDYLEIEFFEEVNLHHYYSWDNNNVQRLKILKHDGVGYNEDLTYLHRDISKQSPFTWMQFTDALPKGRYRFTLDITDTGKSSRIEGEWYVESALTNKFLILHDGVYKKFNKKVAKVETDLVPKMTGFTDGKVTISSDTTIADLSPSWSSFNDINDNTTRGEAGWLTGTRKSSWIQVDFGEKKNVNKYSIACYGKTMADVSTYMPKEWNLKASNTGSFSGEEVTLDARSNQDNWTILEKRDYDFLNTGEYRYYRFNIISNNGQTNIAIGEIEMYHAEADTPYVLWSTVSSTLPTSEKFSSDGMDDLLGLNRQVATLDAIPMVLKSGILQPNEEGKVFGKTIDLTKYIDLKQIRVEGR